MRPPMSSDSEDDYEGFSFGNEFDKPKETRKATSDYWLSNKQKEEEDLNQLLHFVKRGNVDGIKENLLKRYRSEAKINYDDYLKDGWTLLMHAVFNLQFEVVSYLINKGANINYQVDSLTPLMLICKSEGYVDTNTVLKITKLLLDSGAIVNVRDKVGCTPFMNACTYGNKEIVASLIDLAAIDAIDNNGSSAIHYAVQNKHIEIVEMLINARADIEIQNSFGLTPRELAISVGSTEIEELFPEEIIEDVPLESEQYRKYQDLAPTIFPEHDLPPYYQNVPTMLRGMRAEICGKQFYNAKMSLPDFLKEDDDHLKEIGIEFEYQRKRILHGLLKFHRHPYSPDSIAFISENKHKNLFQYYEVYAGYLKHLIIMQSAIDYFLRIGGTENVDQRILRDMLSLLDGIQNNLVLLHTYVQHIAKFSKKNPLFIESVKVQEQRYKRIFGPFLTYTIIIGVGIFLSYKLSKLFT